jgi:hypothetical protein
VLCSFDDRKNFHHSSVIKSEIDRIKEFRPAPPKEVDFKWSLSATKAMYRLNIRNRIDQTLGQMISLFSQLQ